MFNIDLGIEGFVLRAGSGILWGKSILGNPGLQRRGRWEGNWERFFPRFSCSHFPSRPLPR